MFFRFVVVGRVRTFAFQPFEVAPIVLSSFRFQVVCLDPLFLPLCFFTLPRRPEGDNKSGNWNVQQVTLHRMPWGPGTKPKTTTTITPARDPKQSFLFSGGVGRKGQWESCGRHLGGIWDASGKHPRFWKASRRHQTFLTPPQKMNGLWKHLGDLERSIWETSWRAHVCRPGCGTGRPASWAQMIGKA